MEGPRSVPPRKRVVGGFSPCNTLSTAPGKENQNHEEGTSKKTRLSPRAALRPHEDINTSAPYTAGAGGAVYNGRPGMTASRGARLAMAARDEGRSSTDRTTGVGGSDGRPRHQGMGPPPGPASGVPRSYSPPALSPVHTAKHMLPRPQPTLVQQSLGYMKFFIPKPRDTCGFHNLGNTCYVNAVLQSLLSLVPLVHDLLHPDLLTLVSTAECVYPSLVELIREVNHGTRWVISPVKVKDAVSRVSEIFAGGQQQDAHEFFMDVVNNVQQDLLRAAHPSSHGLAFLRPLVSQADGSSRREILCPTHRNFEFVVEHTVMCLACQNRTQRRELFRDLSLDFSPMTEGSSPSLTTLLSSFFADEEVERRCEMCGCERAKALHCIQRYPRILVLHLKRFRTTPDSLSYTKIIDLVTVREDLDLGFIGTPTTLPPLPFHHHTPCTATCHSKTFRPDEGSGHEDESVFLDEESQGDWELERALQESREEHEAYLKEEEELRQALALSSREAMNRDRDRDRVLVHPPWEQELLEIKNETPAQRSSTRYSLHSIVTHIGSLVESGHYVSDVFDPRTRVWTRYNDSVVKEVSKDLVLEDGKKNGYMFFFLSCNL